MQLTELQIETIIAETCGTYRTGGSYTFEDVWNCIEKALAAHSAGAQEPVAWRYQSEDPLDGGEWLLSDTKPNRRNIQPLYTHPQPMPQTDAARDTTRLNALEAGVEVCRHVNPDYWTSRRVGHPWGKTKHADLRSAIDAEIERLDRAKGE